MEAGQITNELGVLVEDWPEVGTVDNHLPNDRVHVQ